MRVSAGFFTSGLSGNTRSHTLPPRLMKRVMATRAASIWRADTRPRSVAWRPYSPKSIVKPRDAVPGFRPLQVFRHFIREGASIVVSQIFLAAIPSAVAAITAVSTIATITAVAAITAVALVALVVLFCHLPGEDLAL